MATRGKVTRNSKELFFAGGMGMIIPLRHRPAVAEEQNTDNQSSKSIVVNPVGDSAKEEK